ncbi:diaminopimelate epimerase [Halobaculum sp. D14]|uniref:diaminopimelate epimerase n=1 Tax=unclassified Halobaculum TaxID=2640896 RepID=UPI003EB89AFA
MTDAATTVAFEKYHGTDNDFLVVDGHAPVSDRGAFAAAHCDRDTGVDVGDGRRGADGVLFLTLDQQFSPARVVMTLVQPDGSVAEMCGNGARCAARWAADRTGAAEFMLDTPAGSRRTVVDGDEVRVEMGRPSFAPADVPLAADRTDPLVEESVEGLTVTAVDTGVPHAVAFVDDVDGVDLDAAAPPVRHADVFPEGANVTLAHRVDDGRFRQRTYERGVEGETRACGTGAVAVAAAARRLGHTDRAELTVSPPGGDLGVELPADGPAVLVGPAEHEFDGELPTDP